METIMKPAIELREGDKVIKADDNQVLTICNIGRGSAKGNILLTFKEKIQPAWSSIPSEAEVEVVL